MDGKLMERDNGCTLMMVVKEWRSGMGIVICESRHGRANEGMGMVEGAATWAGCERWAHGKKMEIKERGGKRGMNGREEGK